MHFYRVILESAVGGAPVDYSHHGTAAEAHTAAKGYADRDRVFVELIDVPTDKAGILDLLRGYDVAEDFKPPVKQWRLTKRGAMEEIPVES